MPIPRSFSRSQDTQAWIVQVWLAWALAVGCTGVGIAFLPANPWQRAFLGMGFLSSINSSFVLAKTIRDRHEAQQQLDRRSIEG
ncbi:MAG: YiaA/YiaB family inner membrane protein [Prochlorothrix sp.]